MQNRLKQFNRVFDVNTDVTDDNITLRAKLLREEAQEFIDSKDIVNQFDAVVDMLYIALGTAELHDIEVDSTKIIRGLLAINNEEYKYVTNKELITEIFINITEYEAFSLIGEYTESHIRINKIVLCIALLSAQCGTLHKLEEGFDEVHRSNMTKVPKDGIILRREDGKILKPDTYQKPNLKEIL